MAEEIESWFDPDIEAVELGYGEKAGLQIYRNYTRSFENHAIKCFREELDSEEIDLSDFRKLAALIAKEDVRFLPVVACGYADELLERAFKAVIPPAVPGGIKSMLSGYGPLADLSKRIKLAYAFDVLSADLMDALDRIRVTRNRIAHDWDLTQIGDFHTQGSISELHPVEALLAGRADDYPKLATVLDTVSAFRVRLIWIFGRLTYETAAYHRAKMARLPPHKALYDKGSTKWLGEISAACLEATTEVIDASGEAGSSL